MGESTIAWLARPTPYGSDVTFEWLYHIIAQKCKVVLLFLTKKSKALWKKYKKPPQVSAYGGFCIL